MKLDKPLDQHTTSELVKLHNSLVPPARAVVRFSTKEVAIRRVKILIEEAQQESESTEAPKTSKAPKAPRKSIVYVQGPDGISEHRSVYVAFEALNLPLGRHQGFRKKLKASGRENFDQYTFSTSPIEG